MDSSVTFSQQMAPYIKYFRFSISRLSSVPSCNHVSAIAPLFLFVLLHIAFPLFCPLSFATGLIRVLLKCDCNTIAFPQSSSLHTVNARDYVISLAGSILSWHSPLGRCDMFINLEKAKTRAHFSRKFFLFKWNNRVCRITVFNEIWPEHSLVHL